MRPSAGSFPEYDRALENWKGVLPALHENSGNKNCIPTDEQPTIKRGFSMITGVHTMFYSSQAEELRAFFRDKIGFPATDVGGGWLIFKLPDTEMGVHPTEMSDGVPSGTADISFICENIEKTVAELKGKGVEFTMEVADHGYGLVTYFKAPGDLKVQLYQPKYSMG